MHKTRAAKYEMVTLIADNAWNELWNCLPQKLHFSSDFQNNPKPSCNSSLAEKYTDDGTNGINYQCIITKNSHG